MTTPRPGPDPFDSVRDAFSGLGTSEKAAFVLEATFATLGQALAETGRRAAAVVDDLDVDSWFRTPPPRSTTRTAPTPTASPEPPPMPATPADLKKTASRPDEDLGDSPPKTAGKPKRRPPADDES